ncbi:NADH-dependent flavin oxidoreductase [Staphylococcus ureilyticus]|uniref:NADH-dependent flavin oxidoreductase n=1 Tax=Staphylococcus ureilyticus TaxID=94138 RepID=UPI0021A352BF|nr:NADH-dependent flavin oxidoreductase [Staphylococcus ureilyticus]MCT1914852.1 NADH-dependent flavin oxidoreductase [Staphylococcus ureilyticus]
MKFEELFEKPILKNGVEINNRVVMAPMTHFSSNCDGTISKDELKYFERRSNGPGMIVTACAYVSKNGKGFEGEPSVEDDDMIGQLTEWANVIKQNGSKAILQLHHGGRTCDPNSVINNEVVAPSNIPAEREATGGVDPIIPRELTNDEIVDIINDFAKATRRAIMAGFDGVELHGANGYLFQQFYSPHANRRTDFWGGSREKRLNFPMEVINKVKTTIEKYADNSFILGYRFTPEEPEEPGLTMADARILAERLSEKDLDYINILLNDYRSNGRREVENEENRLKSLKNVIGNRTTVIAGGSIYTPEDGVDALNKGADLVTIGRELIIEPDWVKKVQENKINNLRTEMKFEDKEDLKIPENLWNIIWNTPGWFPGVEAK